MKKISNQLLDKMIDKALLSKNDSDTDYFMNLLYLGELHTKFTTLSLVSGLLNDTNKTKYSHLCQIVRADGLGDWSRQIDEILTGASSNLLMLEIQQISRELNQNLTKGSWQYETVNLMRECLKKINEDIEPQPWKIQGRNWFALFSRFRNKTRGHGVLRGETISKICPILEESVSLFLNNFSLYQSDTAYLFRNLSGKYKVSSISGNPEKFDYLKTTSGLKYNYSDGIYIYLNTPIKIDLIFTDIDLTDFFFPNGGFSNKNYESISYITGNKEKKDNATYLIPPSNLPGSETEGLNELDVVGNSLTNIPKVETLYIKRTELERELYDLLDNERHPIITLVGRGGIGKTTLALRVLKDICEGKRFDVVFWFSARDIDLLEEGAKLVKPQVINIEDISKIFVKLVQPNKFNEKDFNAKKYLEKQLSKSEFGSILIVIDNFETVENPSELFSWIDTYIRLPNKILITSRIKDFRGDYPLNVGGMTYDEFADLVKKVSILLKISNPISKEYIDKLFQETGGHPYIAKIMLGEVAKSKETGSIKRIAASKDDLLTALFERTFGMLSPQAKLVFLTLSSWRSFIPSIAIEAVIKTRSEEYYEVEDAIEELNNFSFLEKIVTVEDHSEFLFLPLSAYLFGQKKLAVSPFKHIIAEYHKYLVLFGVGHLFNISKGVQSKISLFFKHAAIQIAEKRAKIIDFIPILEYICHVHPNNWMTFSILYEENNLLKDAIHACQNYLQSEKDETSKIDAWKRISNLSRKSSNYFEEAHSLIEMCSYAKSSFETISNSTKRVLALLKEKKLENTPERKLIISKMIKILKSRIDSGDGDEGDQCELAWLNFNNANLSEARKITLAVLHTNPYSPHGLNLAVKLKIPGYINA